MIRNILGSLVAAAGAVSAVLSPFRPWYDQRLGREYRVRDLFDGITATESGVLVSILLPFLFAALLVLAGVVLRSRAVIALAGLVTLGFTVLWMVRQGQAAGSLVVGGDGAGLRTGVANALAGGALMLIGALLMRGRARRRERTWTHGREREREPVEPYGAPPADQVDTWPPTQEPGMSVQTSPWPEQERDPYTGPDPGDSGTRPLPRVPYPEEDPRDPARPAHHNPPPPSSPPPPPQG
ncbi:hypothetical protein [Streptomyces sp. NPDC049916]|uniref:hypothetical protein n=1 Tax=Streptomyces sp. NPDC049916 TaxID=3155156 RepID=UPI0034140F3F